MRKFILFLFLTSCLNGHASKAYLDTWIAVLNTPNYDQCKESTHEY